MAKALGVNDAEGSHRDVTAKGPAAQAGLKPGDVVIKMNGQSVADSAALRCKYPNRSRHDRTAHSPARK